MQSKVLLTFQKHLKMQGKRGVRGPPALPLNPPMALDHQETQYP